MVNITKLSGDSLWDALTSGKPITVDKPKKAMPKACPEYVPQYNPWVNTRIVLLMHVIHCTNCGAESTYPNEHILLESVHKHNGAIHQRALQDVANPTINCSDLPRSIVEHTTRVTVCQHCFDQCAFQRFIPVNSQEPGESRLELIKKIAQTL